MDFPRPTALLGRAMRASLADALALHEQLGMLRPNVCAAVAVGRLEACVATLETAEADLSELATSLYG